MKLLLLPILLLHCGGASPLTVARHLSSSAVFQSLQKQRNLSSVRLSASSNLFQSSVFKNVVTPSRALPRWMIPQGKTVLRSNSVALHKLSPLFTLLRGGATARSALEDSKLFCWSVLLLAIALETVATSLSKRARDVGSPQLFGVACGLYLVCMYGFNLAMSQISVGVAYAIWSAVGTLVVTGMGVMWFGESIDLPKALCLICIVVGVVGLNLLEGASH